MGNYNLMLGSKLIDINKFHCLITLHVQDGKLEQKEERIHLSYNAAGTMLPLTKQQKEDIELANHLAIAIQHTFNEWKLKKSSIDIEEIVEVKPKSIGKEVKQLPWKKENY